jgi:hypothetical protein
MTTKATKMVIDMVVDKLSKLDKNFSKEGFKEVAESTLPLIKGDDAIGEYLTYVNNDMLLGLIDSAIEDLNKKKGRDAGHIMYTLGRFMKEYARRFESDEDSEKKDTPEESLKKMIEMAIEDLMGGLVKSLKDDEEDENDDCSCNGCAPEKEIKTQYIVLVTEVGGKSEWIALTDYQPSYDHPKLRTAKKDVQSGRKGAWSIDSNRPFPSNNGQTQLIVFTFKESKDK